MEKFESPYLVAAKYAFAIIGGGTLAAALVKGGMSLARRGASLFDRPVATPVADEAVPSEPAAEDKTPA